MNSVLFDVKNTNSGMKIAFATLNSEKTLNSLSMEMIQLLSPQLDLWAHDKEVACVVLQGAGEKAFCAGGDIRALYDAMIQKKIGHDIPEAYKFFEKEYDLDYKIHTYPKPVICLGHGIVMGGGLGLLAGSSHRILSERSMIAMPEISIGLYPDVGASWFLNRMPQRTGLFLGLTGARLNANDGIFVGLGDYILPRQHQNDFLNELVKIPWTLKSTQNHDLLSETCLKWQQNHKLDTILESEIRKHYDFIQSITSSHSLLDIFDRFANLQVEDKWIVNCKKTFLSGSPTSAAIIFEQLNHTKHFSLKECFEFEYKLTCQFAKHPDFREGIRALIVDKDNSPKWSPSHINDLNRNDLNRLFFEAHEVRQQIN